jgi:thioredoxin-related protein
MKKIIISFLIGLPFLLKAQENKGVRFEELPGWKQVLAKAKAEDKYIFLDVVATWCAPCKMMDKFTYPDANAGKAINGQFIAVKLQLDSTAADNEQIKRWYGDAALLVKKYNISALPTFLFFSPEGKILHRGTGLKNAEQLITLAKEAVDSNKQIYSILEKYRNGEKQDPGLLPELFQTAKAAGDEILARSIKEEYLDKYVFNKDVASITVREVQFMAEYMQSSDEKTFVLFRNPASAKVIDRIMQQAGFRIRFTQSISDDIILHEFATQLVEVKPGAKEPDWKNLYSTITKKFDSETADRVILQAQQYFALGKKDYNGYSRYVLQKLDKYGMDPTEMGRVDLNNTFYGVVFQYVSDRQTIERSVKWMRKIVDADAADTALSGLLRANNLDTYASLLYKAGRKKEAINWEEKAINQEEQDAWKNKREIRPEFRKTLVLMQNNEFNH